MRASTLLIVTLFGGGCWPEAKASGVCEREMAAAARTHDVPLQVLYAVGLTETGGRKAMQPFAMNVEGRSIFSQSLSEALKTFDAARSRGARSIDIGCMQVNHLYHAKHFVSVAQMFDPHRNVDYAARFLRELRTREPNWTMAVARYNAGPNNDPAQKKYVCAVIRSMVKAGMGAWTASAQALCGAFAQSR